MYEYKAHDFTREYTFSIQKNVDMNVLMMLTDRSLGLISLYETTFTNINLV